MIVLGDGPLRSRLEQLNNELLEGKAEFNLLPTDRVVEYYNSADLYVHAAYIEVECMTALEAMACGLPLLIADSELSATKQFALNKRHLFETQDELTDKINYWFEHRDELAQAKEEYLKFSEQYAIENSYRKLISVYQKVLKRKEETQPQYQLVLQHS
ncbi:MAG TPA: glycosyltransferase [Chitinophagales bacterium]|nr:glycosyltransferase [Chitinophagales bacterium]